MNKAFACMTLAGFIRADCVNSDQIEKEDPTLGEYGIRHFSKCNPIERCPFETEYQGYNMNLTEVRLYRKNVLDASQDLLEPVEITEDNEFLIGTSFIWTGDDGVEFSCSSGSTDGTDYVFKQGTDLNVI